MRDRVTEMVPQLVVELDRVVTLLDRAFGEGAGAAWLSRMRERRMMVDAWTDRDDPPPVFFMLADGEDETDAVGFDDEGVVRGDRFSVRVVSVETGFDDLPLRLAASLTVVPDTRGAQP